MISLFELVFVINTSQLAPIASFTSVFSAPPVFTTRFVYLCLLCFSSPTCCSHQRKWRSNMTSSARFQCFGKNTKLSGRFHAMPQCLVWINLLVLFYQPTNLGIVIIVCFFCVPSSVTFFMRTVWCLPLENELLENTVHSPPSPTPGIYRQTQFIEHLRHSAEIFASDVRPSLFLLFTI